MKSTLYDYVNAILFFVLSFLSIGFFVNSILLTGNKSTHAIYGALFAFFAMYTCPSVTNIWTNNIYQRATNNMEMFYGQLLDLEFYQTNVGEFFRGATFFLLMFTVPTLLANNWRVATVCFAITLIFVFYEIKTINDFKKHIINHLTSTPNSP